MSDHEQISDEDLLTAIMGKNSADKARAALERFNGDFKALTLAAPYQLKAAGLRANHIARLKTAYELGVRAVSGSYKVQRINVSSPAQIVKLLAPRMRDLPKEVFRVVVLDSQNNIKEIIETEQGTVNYASPILREVFHKAIELNASSIVCVHNHPSGNPDASAEDRKFTEALVAAGKVLQIAVLDHIIIAGDKYFSFADEGLISPSD